MDSEEIKKKWLKVKPTEADSTVRQVIVFNGLSKGWPFNKGQIAVLSQGKTGTSTPV
jgi:hypothetical protein